MIRVLILQTRKNNSCVNLQTHDQRQLQSSPSGNPRPRRRAPVASIT